MSYPGHGPSYHGPHFYTHPNGTTILVLGILSLVVCTFIGPFAWALGSRALREIDESGYPYDNRGHIQAGRVCGIVSTVLLIVTFAFIVFVAGVVVITEGVG
ncbi:MAG TPA: DUF4190 domain-containing protein [Nonomuraea sp.]|nr:DUF4190 domain-containing protein [Nonomuraea sp.]